MSRFPTSHFITTDFPALARHLLDHGPRKTHPAARHIRVLFNHTFIASTPYALYVWEHDAYPQYYIPRSALQNCSVVSSTPVRSSAGVIGAEILKVRAGGGDGDQGDSNTTDAVISFVEDKNITGPLSGLVRLDFRSMHQWFEEDVPIYVHPKDPFKRIDILSSSRRIQIKLGGHVLAETTHAMHLHETGLPTRYYVPYTAVDVACLRESGLTSKWPYKGDAEYFHVKVGGRMYEDLVWWYRVPTGECLGVAGMLCFYNEKVDVFIDGVEQTRPKTHFG